MSPSRILVLVLAAGLALLSTPARSAAALPTPARSAAALPTPARSAAALPTPARSAAAEPAAGLQHSLDRYQQLAEDLSVTLAQTAIMQRQIADLQLQMAGERAAVGRVAAATYRGHRLDPLYVLADARNGGEILDRIQLVNAYTERRRQEIGALELTRARYEAVERTLQSLISQQRSQQEQLGALRLKIQQSRRQ